MSKNLRPMLRKIFRKRRFRKSETEIFGSVADSKVSHAGRIYGLSVILAIIALTQWIIIGFFLEDELSKIPRSEVRYGWWLMCTFFGVSVLAWTNAGRKVPYNYLLIAAIVESSTIYIAMEQNTSTNALVTFYAGVIVIALMFVSVFWGAYFPMFVVPGDLILSLLVAIANIMMIIFFINAYLVDYAPIYGAVRNTFALIAVCTVMYTATIIHDRQFDVPKNEYLFLSVLQFFSYMMLQERILNIAHENTDSSPCH